MWADFYWIFENKRPQDVFTKVLNDVRVDYLCNKLGIINIYDHVSSHEVTCIEDSELVEQFYLVAVLRREQLLHYKSTLRKLEGTS